MKGLGPRFAAWRILHDVRHGVPFDQALDRAVKDLEPDDRRLAHELAGGVYRARRQLDRALGDVVDRGLGSVRADTLDVLRLGALQLLLLDRIPRHAAVATTVDVARRLGGERVAGFVNAVLRRLERGAAPAGSSGGLAERYSHPDWLVDRWIARIGPAETEARLARNNERPPLVIQPARWTREAIEAALTVAGVGFRAAPFDAGLVVEVSRPDRLPGFREGGFLVQDSAQRLVARFLAAPAGLVFDACAAPGGKTVALAGGGGFVVAADRTAGRVSRLRDTVERAAGENVAVIRADARLPPIRQADAVLLDVPCLGTGTLARNPDARWRASRDGLARLVRQAADFLVANAEVVAPGGLLLFATCSLEPEENRDQIDRFLDLDRRFRREPSAAVPAELISPEGDLVLLPERHHTDGAFAARLRRVAE